ncbi:MAG: hypothetical protein DCO98_02695 [Altererythrobacter sp. XM-24bin4]|jgi:hypothetical protein|nr:MAG: hypothetical protein DCO98_02695 [Altererythrobacter sp. XM-24bin4]
MINFLVKIWGLIALCPRGIHKRSGSKIRKHKDTYTSACRSCGRPMIRVAKRRWKLIDEA